MPLIPLSQDLAYRFALGTFDVRGWRVETAVDNERVGNVDDLLVDEGGRPRYLDIDLGGLRKHVLLPIGQARVDADAEVVRLPDLSKDQLERIPAYTHDLATLTRDYEIGLSRVYDGVYRGAAPEPGGLEVLNPPVPSSAPSAGAGRLVEMQDLEGGYRIAEGDGDPRGWDVLGSHGEKVGEVDELLVDTALEKVRYLDCRLGERGRGRHVLIPVGYARLDPEQQNVMVDLLSGSEVEGLPTYEGLPLDPGYEQELLAAFSTGGTDDLYRAPRYSPERFYPTS